MKINFLLITSFFILFGRTQNIQLGLNSSLFLSEQNAYSGYNEEQLLPDEVTYSNTKGNLGAGYSYGIEINKFIQPNIALGIALNSFNSFELQLFNYDKNNLKQHLTAQMSQFRLNPKISFYVPVQKFKFLTETGIILPLNTKTQSNFSESNTLNDSTRTYSEQYKYNFSFGFTQKIGFELNLAKKLKLKSSLGILLFSQTTKTRQTTSYEINSKDELGSLKPYDSQTNYYPNLNGFSNNEDFNGAKISEKAKDDLFISHSFSSFEI
ncbi:MAG: hypothetical protein ACK5B9_05515, partial [Flavobacteriia bacterium]